MTTSSGGIVGVPADPEGFVRLHTRLLAPPLVPELRLWTADVLTPLWQATEDALGAAGVEPPFWAFAWPGSQALARWMLDAPGEVAGRRVLDVGAGAGLASLAAARVGATVTANDVDPLALVATALNARENGVEVTTLLGDLVPADPTPGSGDGAAGSRAVVAAEPAEARGRARAAVDAAEIVLVGDLCYEKGTSERLLAWLRRLARDRRVLLAEPGRAFAPRQGVRCVARYVVPTTRELESGTEREVQLLAVEP